MLQSGVVVRKSLPHLLAAVEPLDDLRNVQAGLHVGVQEGLAGVIEAAGVFLLQQVHHLFHSPDGLAPVCHVQEIRILQAKDYDAVKRAVFLYGGVQTSLYLPAENRGGDGNVCYKGSEEPNHDTVIIGWDDDYPKEKFASAPESDGAFLCINSW